MVKKFTFLLICFLTLYILAFTLLYAEEKTWAGAGDGSNWSDENNWFPQVVPTAQDDVFIDAGNANVKCSSTFIAKSVIIGGSHTSTLASENFIFGTITPSSVLNNAILNRSKGKITLRGAGILSLQGQYKDSEESPIAEPSFMMWIK